MEVIHIYASFHDQKKLLKRVAPFRSSGFVRRQIAGDDMRRTRVWREVAEIATAAQVRRRINHLRLAEEWVSAREELVVPRTFVVASIAVARPVDKVTAQANQRPILIAKVQRNPRGDNLKATLDSTVMVIPVISIII